jgi:hypothetical protein
VRIRIEAETRNGLTRIEIIGDGKVVSEHPLEGLPNKAVWETSLPCRNLSWLAVRAFERADHTVRFAHASPTFFAERTSVSKKESALFFVNWMDELISRVENNPNRYSSPKEREEVLDQYRKAREIYASIAVGNDEPSR